MSDAPMAERPVSELIELHRTHGHATLGGVEFDFRHPEIDERWAPSLEIGWTSTFFMFPRRGSPRWFFPWTTIDVTPGLGVRGSLTGRALLRDIAAFGPDDWLGLGDKVSISSVKRFRFGSEFEAEPDSMALRVRYSVERSDGRIERLRGRSIYLHCDRDWSDRFGFRGSDEEFHEGLNLGAVERRIEAILRPGDVDEDGVATDACEPNAAMCWEALAATDNPSTFDGEWRERALIRAGYFLAKAEAVANMALHAERGLAAFRGGVKGGRKSGATRRRNALSLEPHALELALAKRAERPDIGQDDLAAEIQSGWKLDNHMPGMAWLLKFVRAAEADGRLAKRVRKAGS